VKSTTTAIIKKLLSKEKIGRYSTQARADSFDDGGIFYMHIAISTRSSPDKKADLKRKCH
jgi:hypothetical protein